MSKKINFQCVLTDEYNGPSVSVLTEKYLMQALSSFNGIPDTVQNPIRMELSTSLTWLNVTIYGYASTIDGWENKFSHTKVLKIGFGGRAGRVSEKVFVIKEIVSGITKRK
jgi:hypothetical protein